jgi:hypothetical protein
MAGSFAQAPSKNSDQKRKPSRQCYSPLYSTLPTLLFSFLLGFLHRKTQPPSLLLHYVRTTFISLHFSLHSFHTLLETDLCPAYFPSKSTLACGYTHILVVCVSASASIDRNPPKSPLVVCPLHRFVSPRRSSDVRSVMTTKFASGKEEGLSQLNKRKGVRLL